MGTEMSPNVFRATEEASQAGRDACTLPWLKEHGSNKFYLGLSWDIANAPSEWQRPNKKRACEVVFLHTQAVFTGNLYS